MRVKSLFKVQNITVVIAVLIAAAGIYAFAAANVVPESGAGAGSEVVSGYTVTNVTYTLNATDPTVLDAVDFDIAATAGAAAPVSVEVRLDASTSTWYSCAIDGAVPAYTCDTTGTAINVADVDILEVVAAQ